MQLEGLHVLIDDIVCTNYSNAVRKTAKLVAIAINDIDHEE